jgi:DNA-binding NtrC family response regulator
LLALEKIGLQHSTYSVAVIGWRNPRLDGVGLAMELYKIDPGIEIILFSAFDLANRALEHIARTYNVKFDHLSQPFEMSVLLKAINNKVKNGKSDESDFIRRHTLPPESKEDYRKTNDTNWKQRFIWPWGMGVAIGAIILCITLLAWLATLD